MDTLITKRDKVLGFFLVNPTTVVHLRELSRILRISFPWTRKLVHQLCVKKFLSLRRERGLVLIQADRENTLFIALKRSRNLYTLYECGLVSYLTELYGRPEAIVLFGSYARGEDTEQSDIDVVVITPKKLSCNLDKYEKKLQRKIQVKELLKEDIPSEFTTTLINGIVLSGYLQL